MKPMNRLSLLTIILLILNSSFTHADLNTDMVNAHNTARAQIPVPGLVWSDQVAAYALNWAQTLRDQRNCDLVHSTGGPYGENLWKWSGSPGLPAPPATDAVTAWVNERADYNYVTNSCAPGKVCGHYTQVVWRNSQRLGCAFVKCNTGNSYLVSCNYDPPGNYIGQKPY